MDEQPFSNSGLDITHIDYKIPCGEFKFYPKFLSQELVDFYYETFYCNHQSHSRKEKFAAAVRNG